MKYFSMIIYSFFLYPISASQIRTITPKLCIDCKFYTKNFFDSSEFGKCTKFPKENENDYFLVNGKSRNNEDYHYCSTSRKIDTMCGKDGKFYEKK